MSYIKKTILIALFAVLAFTSLGTVTYAWLSVGVTNTVENMDIGLLGEDSLEISLDGMNYYKTLTNEMLMEQIKTVEWISVTSNDNENFYGVRGDVAKRNGDYVDITLWFKTAVKSHTNVYLVDNDKDAEFGNIGEVTGVTSRGVSWTSSHTFLNGPGDTMYAGETRMFYGANALRIGFKEELVEGIGFETVNDNRIDSELNRRIIDPSEDPSRGFGLPFGQYSYFNLTNPPGKPLPPEEEFPDTKYSFTKFYVNPLGNPSPNALDNNTEVGTFQKSAYAGIGGGQIKYVKVRLQIWFEGYDVDAFDSIRSDTVQIKLRFRSGIASYN